jgi:hypothetical protein
VPAELVVKFAAATGSRVRPGRRGEGHRLTQMPMSGLDVPCCEAGARVALRRRELISMARYVIGPDLAIRLAHDQAMIRGGHQVLAPAPLRSQVLSLLYQAVRRGEMTRKDAGRRLEYVRGLRVRLPGTASFRTSHGRPPSCPGGLAPLTPGTWH